MLKYAVTAMLLACFGFHSKEVFANSIQQRHHYHTTHMRKLEKSRTQTFIKPIQKTGEASWYGGKFLGRKTASGEIFSSKKFTCAHKTLPLGTTLEVKSLQTNKKVIVVVNDRGPYVGNRIIDLSPIAAKTLGMQKSGVEKVTIRTVKMPTEYAEYKNK